MSPEPPSWRSTTVPVQRLLFLIFVTVFSELSIVMGYPTGAPASMCDTMMPHHGTYQPQTSTPPYAMSFSSNTVKAGENITVTLTADNGYYFKGFLVKAVPNNSQNQAVGSFAVDNAAPQVYQLLTCSDSLNSAITHTSGSEKKNVMATWTAPRSAETVDFLATVVYNGSTFWTSFKSAKSVSVTPNSDIQQSSAPTAPVVLPPPFTFNYTQCGTNISCMGYPSGCVSTKNCQTLLTFVLSSDRNSVNFDMISKLQPSSYVAMAFSTDKKMGDDSVIECLDASNGVQIFSATNRGHENIKSDVNSGHFTGKGGSMVEGILRCSFNRPMETVVGGIDTNLKTHRYYLFMVTGPLKPDRTNIAYHSHKMYSVEEVDLSSEKHIIVLGGDALPVPVEIIIHGSFMVVAWIGTVSIAIFLARYYKDMWPEKTHCNVKIWFAWHRGLNVLTVLLTAAAFILIFVFAGITPLWQSSNNIHPILGTVTVILMILQPVGALFRPNPGTPRRPIFNWLHYFGGMFASICAVITIFFAVTLKAAQLPTYFWWILIAYVAFYVVLFCVMEFFTCLSARKAEKEVIPMKDYSNGHDGSFHIINQTEPQGARFKEVMLMLFSVGVLGFTAALVALIAT